MCHKPHHARNLKLSIFSRVKSTRQRLFTLKFSSVRNSACMCILVLPTKLIFIPRLSKKKKNICNKNLFYEGKKRADRETGRWNIKYVLKWHWFIANISLYEQEHKKNLNDTFGRNCERRLSGEIHYEKGEGGEKWRDSPRIAWLSSYSVT